MQLANVFILHPSQQRAVLEKNIATEFTDMNLLQRCPETSMRTIDHGDRTPHLQRNALSKDEKAEKTTSSMSKASLTAGRTVSRSLWSILIT